MQILFNRSKLTSTLIELKIPLLLLNVFINDDLLATIMITSEAAAKEKNRSRLKMSEFNVSGKNKDHFWKKNCTRNILISSHSYYASNTFIKVQLTSFLGKVIRKMLWNATDLIAMLKST